MDFEILREFPPSGTELLWREYISRLECASHYDTPEFFREPFMVDSRPFAVLAKDRGKIVGVLTGLQPEKNVACGLPARPQISIDPTADSAAVLTSLADGLMQVSKTAGLISVYTWPSLELPAFEIRGFRHKQLLGNVVLDLSIGADALFKQFAKDRRRNIRFAEKNGIEVTQAVTDQDYADAYSVYSTWRTRRGAAARGSFFSFDLYKKTMELKGNRLLLIARHSGKPVATNVFRFCPGGLFESSANNSLDEFIHLKPNDLLQWRGIEWACANGLRCHSLGGSHQFLLRFGGAVVPILRYRLDRTFLRRNDLHEAVEGFARRVVRNLPPFAEKGLRKLAGKENEKISRK
jgi:Acetyltransferase (GNAT) domain